MHGGGGILIYMHENIAYKTRSQCEHRENNVQFLHVQITSPVELDLVAMYSPPNHGSYVIDIMDNYLTATGRPKNIMFIGDTNIDLNSTKSPEENTTEESESSTGKPAESQGKTPKIQKWLIRLEEEYQLRQLIKKPTHGKSLIDHIFTNTPEEFVNVLPNKSVPYSKHKVVGCTLRLPTVESQGGQVIRETRLSADLLLEPENEFREFMQVSIPKVSLLWLLTRLQKKLNWETLSMILSLSLYILEKSLLFA